MKVFVSYNHEDKDLKDILKLRLESTDNFEGATDDVFLRGGMDYFYRIYHEIITCDLFSVILTENYVNSRFCLAESQEARKNRKKFIIFIVGAESIKMRAYLREYRDVAEVYKVNKRSLSIFDLSVLCGKQKKRIKKDKIEKNKTTNLPLSATERILEIQDNSLLIGNSLIDREPQSTYIAQSANSSVKGTKNITISMISMICGIFAVAFFYVLHAMSVHSGIAGVVLSIIARKKGHNGMNTTGLVLGIIGAILGCIFIFVAGSTYTNIKGYDYYYTVFAKNFLK